MSKCQGSLQVFQSIEREFHSAVIMQLPDLTDEEMQRYNRNKEELSYLLQNALTPNIFSVTCEGLHKTSELIQQGKSQRKYEWAEDQIMDKRFPLLKHVPVKCRIKLMNLVIDMSSEEVLAEFSRCGLERPTYEQALYFAIQYPDEQRENSIVFLHEPVQDSGGNPIVLVLYRFPNDRSLRSLRFGSRCSHGYIYAAVCK